MEDSIVEENADEGINLWEAIMLVLIFLVISMLVSIPAFIVINILSYFIKGIKEYGGILTSIAGYCVFLKYVKDKQVYNKIRMLPMSKVKYILYGIVLLIGYRLIYDNSLGIVLDNILKHNNYQNWANKILSNTVINPIAGFISLCIIAPIFEEIICRGIILEQLRKKCNVLKAVIISALCFTVIHLNIEQGVNAFLIGLILGWLYIKTESILPGVLLHFLNNFLIYLLIYFPIKCIVSNRFSVLRIVIGIVIFAITIVVISKKEQDTNQVLKV